MFKTISSLLRDPVSGLVGSEPDPNTLPLAVAALMFEISRADHDIQPEEKKVISESVSSVCGISAADIEALLGDAEVAVEDSVSLYEFTSVINDHFENARKFALLEMLWRVAWADGSVDRYEDYYIRKIADLLHLSQKDFIRAKHNVIDA
jgi:uncharacterized tellurite resistance protein B-like protein